MDDDTTSKLYGMLNELTREPDTLADEMQLYIAIN
jgi:hypothetical protein